MKTHITKLVPLNIVSPAKGTLDPDLARKLFMYRQKLGFLDITDEYSKCCRIRIRSVDFHTELKIWRAFLYIVNEESFSSYLKSYGYTVPYEILAHYEKARNTCAFLRLELWVNLDRNFGLLMGIGEDGHHILAEWQHVKNDPLIDFELVMDEIMDGKCPAIDDYKQYVISYRKRKESGEV